MTESKTIEGWLVVDWKEESHRTRKNKPTSLGTNELLAKLSVEVSIPDVDVPELALQIDVPEPQVFAATMEALDDEQLPDWTDTAASVVEDNEYKLADCETGAEIDDVADQLTTQVLLEVETRPDPGQVRQYVRELVYQVGGEDS